MSATPYTDLARRIEAELERHDNAQAELADARAYLPDECRTNEREEDRRIAARLEERLKKIVADGGLR